MTLDSMLPKGGNPAEADFLKALNRLVKREPKKERLKKLKDAGKPLITFANVAHEAGRSRTSIGHDKCRYKEVRLLITDAIEAEGERLAGRSLESERGKTSREIIRDLRNENDYLVNEKRLLAKRINEALNVADTMKNRLARAERAAAVAERKAQRLQSILDGRAGNGTVVPFPSGDN